MPQISVERNCALVSGTSIEMVSGQSEATQNSCGGGTASTKTKRATGRVLRGFVTDLPWNLAFLGHGIEEKWAMR